MLVKICCIKDLKEARLALQFGANWLGLVSEMPSGPGVISVGQIAQIISHLPSTAKTVLLTSKTKAQDIQRHHGSTHSWGIQLVDAIPHNELLELRSRLPEVTLIQVIHVQNSIALDLALKYQNFVDYLLLDSGNPNAQNRTLGGTGETHDWDISAQICHHSSIPVFLAGGLNSSNVGNAINLVRPAGVDLCSGVRTGGSLDPSKLAAFFESLY